MLDLGFRVSVGLGKCPKLKVWNEGQHLGLRDVWFNVCGARESSG